MAINPFNPFAPRITPKAAPKPTVTVRPAAQPPAPPKPAAKPAAVLNAFAPRLVVPAPKPAPKVQTYVAPPPPMARQRVVESSPFTPSTRPPVVPPRARVVESAPAQRVAKGMTAAQVQAHANLTAQARAGSPIAKTAILTMARDAAAGDTSAQNSLTAIQAMNAAIRTHGTPLAAVMPSVPETAPGTPHVYEMPSPYQGSPPSAPPPVSAYTHDLDEWPNNGAADGAPIQGPWTEPPSDWTTDPFNEAGEELVNPTDEPTQDDYLYDPYQGGGEI